MDIAKHSESIWMIFLVSIQELEVLQTLLFSLASTNTALPQSIDFAGTAHVHRCLQQHFCAWQTLTIWKVFFSLAVQYANALH